MQGEESFSREANCFSKIKNKSTNSKNNNFKQNKNNQRDFSDEFFNLIIAIIKVPTYINLDKFPFCIDHQYYYYGF